MINKSIRQKSLFKCPSCSSFNLTPVILPDGNPAVTNIPVTSENNILRGNIVIDSNSYPAYILVCLNCGLTSFFSVNFFQNKN